MSQKLSVLPTVSQAKQTDDGSRQERSDFKNSLDPAQVQLGEMMDDGLEDPKLSAPAGLHREMHTTVFCIFMRPPAICLD